jgi:hypothetical protein
MFIALKLMNEVELAHNASKIILGYSCHTDNTYTSFFS